MYTEQITLVIGSEYARSHVAADQYAKLTAAEQRRSAERVGRPRLGRLGRLVDLIRRSRIRAVKLPQLP